MTLILVTESHGNVESGFYGGHTKYTRLGDYTFATKHFCELVQYLAVNPETLEAKLLGYGADKYWENGNEYMAELIQAEISSDKDAIKKFENQQGEISLKDDLDLNNEGKMISVKVSEDKNHVILGKYKINSLHFGRFAYYVAHGGFMGWFHNVIPSYAKEAMNAIKESESDLFKHIKAEMEDDI